MGKYVEQNLLQGEAIIYEGKVSVWSLLPLVILGLVTISFGIGLIFWAMAAIKYFTTELAITNKRIIAKFGLIKRTTVELRIEKVEGLRVQQSILGRVCGYGTIIVSGAGNHAPIPSISDPMNFRRAFTEVQEELSSK